MKLDIYLRGGQTITLDVEDWKLEKNRNNELLLTEFVHTGTTKMPYLRLDNVSAIVRRD